MNWIGNFFFCVGTLSLTGSIAFCIVLLIQKGLDRFSFGLRLRLMKLIAVLYLLPIVYPAMRLSRYQYTQGNWVYEGIFGEGSSGIVAKIFQLVGVIWLIGMGIGIIVRAVEYLRLQKLFKQNEPLTQAGWKTMIRQERWKKALDGIEIRQNESLLGPIVTGIGHPVIVLPVCDYTDKEMCMVLDHEIRHVKSHDLWWKRLALLATWLHWFNPLVYLLLDRMIVEQEVECDVSICQSTSHYTAKEYALFLLSLEEMRRHRLFEATLFESKKSIVRRIEEMKIRGKDGKVNRLGIVLAGVLLVVMAVITTYLIAEVIADYEEKWIYGTESGTQAEGVELPELDEIRTDQDVSPEEDITTEQLAYSSMATIDFSAKGNTRYLYPSQYYQEGDTIQIFAGNADDTAVFRVGIKKMNSGELIYVEGSRTLIHTFFIDKAGDYRVFVQNCSEQRITVGGCIYRELKADKEQIAQIKQEHKLSDLTMEALTTELDIRYTNLRGVSDAEETKGFQVYWDVNQETYVVIMDGANGKVSEVFTVRAEDKIWLFDAEEQIEKGKYTPGGKLVLLHDGEFVMEATTEDREELLRDVGGYMMRSISGVGVEKSGGKAYGVKAFLSGLSTSTDVCVYYACGYDDIGSLFYSDIYYDLYSHLYVSNTRFFDNPEVSENELDLLTWLYRYGDIQSEGDLFLNGRIEENMISSENDISVDWGAMLHAVWMLWLDGKDTVEGTIKGEIYLSEVNGSSTDHPIYKGWICLEGEEPVKVSARDSRELAKTVNIDKDAVFSDGETEAAVGKLTFELTIGQEYQMMYQE